jgi:hypothetical protein
VKGRTGCWTAASRFECEPARGLAPYDDRPDGAARFLEPSQDGRHRYVGSDEGLAVFSVDRPTGRLRQVRGTRGCIVWSPQRAGRQSCAHDIRFGGHGDLALSADGGLVYSFTQGAGTTGESGDIVDGPGTVTALVRDRRSGVLAPVPGRRQCVSSSDYWPAPKGCRPAPFTWDAVGLVVTRDRTNAYVLDDDLITSLGRDGRTGTISPPRRPFGCIGVAAERADCRNETYFEQAVLSPDERQFYTVDIDRPSIRIWRRAT